ncbi:DUF6809 family protein [Vallitalea guaymasensis]|uniref:Uncharacterized protein n=1 Tax=Vallitalea guaymasensis TaxID=1185412 RepID=A0A8J8SAU5_9FIRM|nr:DUF6809 family protein [Vallitalea guaymasensis]QUH28042.1 hypothetical protein HYG85_03570 [Vallitalea guaymasensis]
MKPIIEQLFNGEIDSFKNFIGTDEYNKCSSEVIKEENEFLKQISQEQRQIYDKLLDIKSQRSVVGNKIHFVYGFKTGFKLAYELLYDEDNN